MMRSIVLLKKITNLFFTECKEVMDTSDGDYHQLLGNGSRQLLRTEVANDYSVHAALFRRLADKRCKKT